MNMMTTTPVVESWAAMTERHIEEREAAILDLAAADLTVAEAAAALGASPQTIHGFISRYGVCASFSRRRRRRPKKGSSAMKIERIKLSLKGHTIEMGAEILGITLVALTVYSKRHGINWRSGLK